MLALATDNLIESLEPVPTGFLLSLPKTFSTQALSGVSGTVGV